MTLVQSVVLFESVRMFGRLFALFVFVPLIELILLIQISARVGLGPTLGLIVITGAIGAFLARNQGLLAFRRIQNELAAGRVPADEMIEGMLVLVGGAVLLTPGLLTDIAGFLLMVPGIRRSMIRRLRHGYSDRLRRTTAAAEGDAIDV